MDSPNTNPRNANSLDIQPDIRGFLENILQEAQMTFTDETMKEEVVQELFKRLDNFIAARTVENLPPEKLEEFIKLNEEKRPQEEIQKFMTENVPNSQKVFSDAFTEFRDLYLGKVSVGRNAPQDIAV